MSKPCRYQYQPGGCRRSNCTFSHSAPGATSSDHRPRAPPMNNHTSVVPKGICKFYWSNGRCDKDSSCRFKHTRNQSESAARPSAPDALFPFLTDEGLAKVTGANTDSLSPKLADPLTPGDVYHRMKRFLADDFHFKTTFDVYSFFVPFNSAISTNPTWTHEDGQTFLTDVTKERSLLRMSEVLRWTQVSTLAGSNSHILSFQRAWIPFLRFLSSNIVVKSTLHQHVNALYSIIMNNFESFSNTLITSMDGMISRQSFVDHLSPATKNLIGSQVFASISGVLFQCLTRFKNAISTHPQIVQTVRKLQAWLNVWVQGIKDDPPKFDNMFRDNIVARDHIISHLTIKVQSVVDIVDREEARNERLQKKATPANPRSGSSRNATEGLAAMLNMSFDGPGELCSTGRRHNNDEIDIRDIRIAPTHEELICKAEPFLPANFYEAPHHLPPDSMERLFDIQFRLLREELTAPLRSSISHVRNDLMNKSPKTKLATILEKKGGKYRTFSDVEDSVMFNVYTGVTFHSMTPDLRGLSVNISLDTPPGRARQVNGHARATFWEQTSGKRLMQGGLVALVWSRNNGQVVDVHLGKIASSLRELAESARQRENKISSRIVFFDSAVELQILSVLKFPDRTNGDQVLLVEAPMMYEAIRPFLEALTVEPTTIPFQEYLVHRPQEFFDSCSVKAPHYATLPRFKYGLECLFDRGAREEGFELAMVVNDPDSVENARNELKRGSRLDPSQVDAIVCALTREVALIQGPPGTGKSYTGVELLRVLVTGRIRPILMIAFTNHALDHLLSSVLNAEITRDIVRLGSRSADERICQYSIENLETASDMSRLSRNFGANYRKLKNNQEELISLVKDFAHRKIVSSDITAYIQVQYPEHHEHISNPPSWITTLMSFWSHSKEEDGWQTARKQGSRWSTDYTTYGSWLRGEDLEFLKTRPDLPATNPPGEKLPKNPPEISNTFNMLSIDTVEDSETSDSLGGMKSESDSETDSDSDSEREADWQRLKFPTVEEQQRPASPESDISTPYVTPDETVLHLSDIKDPLAFFVEHCMNSIPEVPTTDRPLDALLAQGSMWDLSLNERKRLDRFWRERTREDVFQSQLEQFETLRKKHEVFLELVNEGKNEIRRSLLQNVDIIGCTTAGAAKYASLLRGIGPKVLIIEEAGQVMEAHVLGNLVPSIEHLIMIGDPLQLRPTLNNYKLSVDSRRGSRLYKFDMSLMERLSKSGFPMSRIDIQRRMRPDISKLIRNALYPGLEDHDLVKQYPNVRGFAHNVFFLTHEHRENDGNEDDSASKYNTYEVQMIKDMVLYLLRQGCYSQDGDIVVLCAYLGQLARVRDALARHVAVVLDERDQEELADCEAEDELEEARVEHIQVAKRVRLRTVDNYQGEEAKIVILSLVRNAGRHDDEDDGGSFGRTIGFLKSENRTNVALSRAKHGLLILGNAAQLACKSRMWNTVLDELQRNGNIGEGFPVACHRHPDIINYVSEPGQLPRFAPDGGCLRPCEYRLKCGHVCPYKCHTDDVHHVAVVCSQSCRRLCIRRHPCSKQCSVECGQCLHPIPHVKLPCGHVADSVHCYMMEDLDSFRCNVIVTKQLTSCEHTAELACSTDVSEHRCSQPCNGIMECCGRSCNASCFQCQAENQMDGVGQIQRAIHRKHPCKKPLYCGHECTLHCSQDHECVTTCREACRQQCAHSSCSDYCSTPCEPCKEVCTWTCSHHVCLVPCGSVCTRLPCDKKCDKVLKCGHRCPSVCGEDCDIQICPTCAPRELQETVVDFILYLQLCDVLTDEESPDNMLITLPICGHVFTVETLDGLCSLGEYYTKTEQGRWVGLTTPEHAGERRKPPVCPTCRAAITSPRYGRVFKSANLDVLERNVISHMSNRMNKVQASWNQIIKAEMECTLATEAKSVEPTIRSNEKEKKARRQARKTILDQKDQRPVSVDGIIPNDKLFSISPQATQVWKKVVRGLIKVYKDAADVCDIRSAHTNAWEAAFSFLYEQELDKAVADPAHAPRRPQEHAMRVARMNVGVPQPRADQRFLVEAIWATLQVRFTLVELAQIWIKAVENSANYPPSERMEWGVYGVFLLSSCERDIEIAHEIAKESGSRRQMTRTKLLSLRAKLEKCRINIEMTKQCGLWDQEQRLKYADQAKEEGVAAEQIIVETMKEHSKALRSDIPWSSENFYEPAKAIREEWKNLEQTLNSDTFYAPVSFDEKMAIVKAFSFSHTGHFYTCRNGHAFVITECGGAMEASRCPECGERIGGQDHALDASNRRAEELESLAHQAGSLRSPWVWGQ